MAGIFQSITYKGKIMKFSNQMIEGGQFCTVTFVTKSGEIRTINGRTGVKKYIKGTGDRSKETVSKYLLVWTRNGSRRFDAARNIARDRIVEFKAHGVIGKRNKFSDYPNNV